MNSDNSRSNQNDSAHSLPTATSASEGDLTANDMDALIMRFRNPRLDLSILQYTHPLRRIHQIAYPLLITFHIPFTLYLDFSALYILAQIGVHSPATKNPLNGELSNHVNLWWIALAIYAASTTAWLFGIVIIYEFLNKHLRKWSRPMPSMLDIYLSAPSFNYACVRDKQLYSFLYRLRSSAHDTSTSERDETDVGNWDWFIETAWWYAQNWKSVVTVIPRALLALLLLLAFNTNSSGMATSNESIDETYFRNDGSLTTYATTVLLINVCWAAWRLLIVCIASIYLLIALGLPSIEWRKVASFCATGQHKSHIDAFTEKQYIYEAELDSLKQGARAQWLARLEARIRNLVELCSLSAESEGKIDPIARRALYRQHKRRQRQATHNSFGSARPLNQIRSSSSGSTLSTTENADATPKASPVQTSSASIRPPPEVLDRYTSIIPVYPRSLAPRTYYPSNSPYLVNSPPKASTSSIRQEVAVQRQLQDIHHQLQLLEENHPALFTSTTPFRSRQNSILLEDSDEAAEILADVQSIIARFRQVYGLADVSRGGSAAAIENYQGEDGSGETHRSYDELSNELAPYLRYPSDGQRLQQPEDFRPVRPSMTEYSSGGSPSRIRLLTAIQETSEDNTPRHSTAITIQEADEETPHTPTQSYSPVMGHSPGLLTVRNLPSPIPRSVSTTSNMSDKSQSAVSLVVTESGSLQSREMDFDEMSDRRVSGGTFG